MSESSVRALVAGHADFAAGLVSAVDMITGQGDALEAIVARDLGADDIRAMLAERMRATGAHVIFTDLQAGSCTMAARKVLREVEGSLLVSGANLPMLLDFVLSRSPDTVQAAIASAERGRGAISATGGPA